MNEQKDPVLKGMISLCILSTIGLTAATIVLALMVRLFRLIAF